MPNLVQSKKANFGGAKSKGKAKPADDADEEESTGGKSKAASGTLATRKGANLIKGAKSEKYNSSWVEDDGEDDEGDDEVIETSLEDQKNGKGLRWQSLVLGAIVVIVVVLAFLIFNVVRNSGEDEPTPQPNTTEPAPTVTTPDGPGVPSVGTQDFSGDTNRVSDSPLSDPNDFIKDIYGLTLQVNYEVAEIQSAADFVNYTKHRGTWGGGLELYWLEASYKGNDYVVQVPFRYYKELDDTGIVPVKMEVLRIKSDTSSDYLTVVSYMELDINTLQTILKSQTKK